MTLPTSVAEFLESEHVLSSQFFTSTADADTPEKALIRAVLARAIDDLTAPKMLNCYGARGRTRTQREAAAWFLSGDDTYLFSFVAICLTLNLDAGAIRKALLAPQREAA